MTPARQPANVAASVRARLLNLPRLRKVEFQLLLSDFAIERLLYRIGISAYADRFVLKGAMLFNLWPEVLHRATWDLDLLGRGPNTVADVIAVVRDVCGIEVDDAIAYDPSSVRGEGIEPAMVKADCFRFRLDLRRVVPQFAAYQLSATATAAAGSLATGATRARMNLTTTATRKIALPPLPEQQAAVDALDRETRRCHALVAKVRDAIERLQELRTALISAAVTGKIDVRTEAA
jgi:hypothetical protein